MLIGSIGAVLEGGVEIIGEVACTKSDELIKTLIFGSMRIMGTIVPLSKYPCAVSTGFKHFG